MGISNMKENKKNNEKGWTHEKIKIWKREMKHMKKWKHGKRKEMNRIIKKNKKIKGNLGKVEKEKKWGNGK